MKTWWIFGFELWRIRPAKMWQPSGRCFVSLLWGMWLRWPFDDLSADSVPAPDTGLRRDAGGELIESDTP